MKREIFERYVIQVASVTMYTPTWLHVKPISEHIFANVFTINRF
jgi:hypothetical protein